jgi:GAF domain-containing protein
LLHSVVDKIFESNSIKQEESQKKIRLTLRSQQTVENLQLSISKITQELFNVESSQFLDKSASYLQDNKETSQYLKSTGKILIPEELPYRFEEEERFFSIHQELEKTDYSALVPLGQDDIFMGCIVLGKRKNHAAYTVEEVREMKQLQDQFTEALWNARLYQQAIARIKI